MILAIVRATAHAGMRAQLQHTAEAICCNTSRCLAHDLYLHPSDENVMVCLSKWTGESSGSERREDPSWDDVRMGFMGVLTPLCDSVEVELHSVGQTARNKTATTESSSGVASNAGATFSHVSKRRKALGQGKPAPGEEEVRIVERHIQAHLDEDLAVTDLAAAARVSVRTLFRCFRRLRGRSPMKVLETARLEHARKHLLEGSDSDTVTRVAMSSGFTHLGRFSAVYKRTYGESPSRTRRRSQHSSSPDQNGVPRLQDAGPGPRTSTRSGSSDCYGMDRRFHIPSSLQQGLP